MAKKQQGTTFDDVKKAFQEKDVELLSDENDYKNKRIVTRDKFLMKTKICNHEKMLSWNECQQNQGFNYCQQCYFQQRRIKYSDIVNLFEKIGCFLLTTEQEFDVNKMNSDSSFIFTGNCGHQCKITYTNLLLCHDKKNCKKCTDKDKAQKWGQNSMEKSLQLAKKICTEKNFQYLNTVYKKGGCVYYILRCREGHQFQKTIGQLKNGEGCKICTFDVEQFQQNVSTGDYHEQCVFNMIKNQCKTIEIVGNTGNLYDIIYTLDDDIKRGIQVKSLSQIKYKNNVFGCSVRRPNGKCYPQDTLMVFINKKQQRFIIDMYQNFNSKTFRVQFNSDNCKYKNIKFTDQELFQQRLISLLPKSAQIDTTILYSDSMQKEILCFERLQRKCQELGLSFQRYTTNGGPIDCYINHKAIQVKYSETKCKQNSVVFDLRKSGGLKNGKLIRVPYNQKDQVQFFVFEYGGENKIYQNQYCILSKEFLMQKEYISNDNVKGKTAIYIWKPDSETNKDKIGTSNFWDKFDQLQ